MARDGSFKEAAQSAESLVDRAKIAVKRRFDLFDPVEILPFKGYGTEESMIVMGRVLEESGVRDLDRDAGFWRNLANTVRRIDSDEIPDARIEAYFNDETWDDQCDGDGYFHLVMKPDGGLDPGWVEVDLELVESIAGNDAAATARVLIPSPDAEFMVISDIDDTVIETGAMDTWRMLRHVAFQNARQRRPFPGVVALYSALLLGPDEAGRNPIFYLSRSGWPLFDLFDEVFRENDIPEGPLLLRDLRIVEEKSTKLGSDSHKLDDIRNLLDTYDYPVVLIGDSGQGDPEVYHEIVEDQADRVEAVYIRHVVGAERAAEITDLYRDHLDKLCLAPSTVEMARHGVVRGLISENQLKLVREGLVDDLDE